MEISRTATADTTTWTALVDGVPVSWLSVWTANGEIAEVETRAAHQGTGYARALYAHADSDFRGGIWHTIESHRTEEGAAFARAVGGYTIDERDALVVAACCCDHCDAP
jgi:GNAT superfamily N-acetyltransferase